MNVKSTLAVLAAALVSLALTPLAGLGAEYHHVHLAVASPSLAIQWYEDHMECTPIADRSDAVRCPTVEITFGADTTVGGSAGTGVNHIAFSFPDLDTKMAELERAGVGGRGVRLQRFEDGSMISEIPGVFAHGFVFDPWGTRIELVADADRTGFHHVHLSATDPDASLEWYANVMGGERTTLAGQLDAVRFDNAWLIVDRHPEGVPASTTDRAIQHLGFMVSDLDEAASGMRQYGVGFTGEPESGQTSARRAYVAGPDSVSVAVVEPGWVANPTLTLFTDAGAGPVVDAETYVAPRTPWGAPDLEGIWTSNRAHGIPLERPGDIEEGEELTPEEAAARRERGTLGSIWGYEREWRDTTLGFVDDLPSTQVAMVVDPPDGRIPPLTAEAGARRGGGGFGGGGLPAGPEDLSDYVRCITQGLPSLMMPTIYNNGLQIVQSPTHVAITKEMIHETRIIPTDGSPPLSENITQWLGDSRGYWDGDSLVVEVRNFNGRAMYRGASPDMTLVERYTRVSPTMLMYEFTVDDPATWTRPWTAMFTFDLDNGQYELVEYACHEGNYAMINILTGARAQEAAAASDSQPE
jgi:catechol 2,3-dioxygenase-like lactoylglutathione lyase family enzyme